MKERVGAGHAAPAPRTSRYRPLGALGAFGAGGGVCALAASRASCVFGLVVAESATMDPVGATRTYPDISWWSALQKSVQ